MLRRHSQTSESGQSGQVGFSTNENPLMDSGNVTAIPPTHTEKTPLVPPASTTINMNDDSERDDTGHHAVGGSSQPNTTTCKPLVDLISCMWTVPTRTILGVPGAVCALGRFMKNHPLAAFFSVVAATQEMCLAGGFGSATREHCEYLDGGLTSRYARAVLFPAMTGLVVNKAWEIIQEERARTESRL